MRQRLNRGGVAVDYQVERSNDRWYDHQARTLVTGSLIAWLKPESVLDPACGDGSIVAAAERAHPIKQVTVADISEPNWRSVSERHPNYLALHMDIAKAIGYVAVDVVVLTEILEHLDDPDSIVRAARDAGRYLVASSPVMRPGQVDGNPEHLWMFDEAGYREMLESAGWQVVSYTLLGFPATCYDFGIWVCR